VLGGEFGLGHDQHALTAKAAPRRAEICSPGVASGSLGMFELACASWGRLHGTRGHVCRYLHSRVLRGLTWPGGVGGRWCVFGGGVATGVCVRSRHDPSVRIDRTVVPGGGGFGIRLGGERGGGGWGGLGGGGGGPLICGVHRCRATVARVGSEAGAMKLMRWCQERYVRTIGLGLTGGAAYCVTMSVGVVRWRVRTGVVCSGGAVRVVEDHQGRACRGA